MITIKYIDGTKEDFPDANHYEGSEDNDFTNLIKRKYDSDDDYDEEEDETIACINDAQIRSIYSR